MKNFDYILTDTEFEAFLLECKLRNDILFYFNKSPEKSIQVGKDEVDESQIIYTYIKSKSNNCTHVVIPDKWLNDPDYIANSINKLLL